LNFLGSIKKALFAFIFNLLIKTPLPYKRTEGFKTNKLYYLIVLFK